MNYSDDSAVYEAPLDCIKHSLFSARIDARGRFVEQDDLALFQSCSSYAQKLLLGSTQIAPTFADVGVKAPILLELCFHAYSVQSLPALIICVVVEEVEIAPEGAFEQHGVLYICLITMIRL